MNADYSLLAVLPFSCAANEELFKTEAPFRLALRAASRGRDA
jgi:hypothetical protein